MIRIRTRHDLAKIRLALELKGQTEVLCRVGRVDVVTGEEAIEVKATKRWKEGLGQAIAYGLATEKLPRLHLYGEKRLEGHEEEIISAAGVRISYDLNHDCATK